MKTIKLTLILLLITGLKVSAKDSTLLNAFEFHIGVNSPSGNITVTPDYSTNGINLGLLYRKTLWGNLGGYVKIDLSTLGTDEEKNLARLNAGSTQNQLFKDLSRENSTTINGSLGLMFRVNLGPKFSINPHLGYLFYSRLSANEERFVEVITQPGSVTTINQTVIRARGKGTGFELGAHLNYSLSKKYYIGAHLNTQGIYFGNVPGTLNSKSKNNTTGVESNSSTSLSNTLDMGLIQYGFTLGYRF